MKNNNNSNRSLAVKSSSFKNKASRLVHQLFMYQLLSFYFQHVRVMTEDQMKINQTTILEQV